jgi:hypothetical protein
MSSSPYTPVGGSACRIRKYDDAHGQGLVVRRHRAMIAATLNIPSLRDRRDRQRELLHPARYVFGDLNT